jgi:hypothetical protein
MSQRPVFTSETFELFEPAKVLRDIQARVSADRPLGLLVAEVRQRGYEPAKGAQNVVGFRHSAKSVQPVKPPKGATGAAVQDASFEIRVQDYAKRGTRDRAAVLTATVKAGGNSDTYQALLEAPRGDFSHAREFMVKGNAVVPANSWWSAARSCVTKNCTSVCVSSLFTCSGTWAAYIACIAAKCGLCWLKCAACATCNCKWWCKWAAGCCKQ